MKATIEVLSTGRFEITGLRKPNFKTTENNGKETYEMVCLRSTGTYKTFKMALKKLLNAGYEYIPAENINIVVGYN